MFDLQQALIDRVKNATDENGTAIFNSASVDAYAGQISDKGIQSSIKLPAALIMFRSGGAPNEPEGTKFDILVITESQSYQKKTHLNNNLKASGDLARFLKTYPGFSYNGTDYLITERSEKINSGLVLQNNRHTIIAVSVRVRKL